MGASKQSKRSKHKQSFHKRHKILTVLVGGLLAIVIILVAAGAIGNVIIARQQSKLQPFYDTQGLSTAGPLGQVVRQEPLDVALPGGRAVRILYRTQRADGSITFSSGMVFLPTQSAQAAPRPIVAWAHGTLGLGDQCAPSRTPNPIASLGWVSQMMARGWIVTATDYAGFGTAGTQGYLVGGDEAHDVLNSVRAARSLSDADASNKFVIWGHSQGGNSALFSAASVSAYAPELQLEGTVASAPAAELIPLFEEQYGTVADWVIGPLITTAWPAANPTLSTTGLLTSAGQASYMKIANQCIVKATLGGLVRSVLHQKFFSADVTTIPSWRAMAQQQSAPILSSAQPLMVVESKTDQVVLPNTTALYIQTVCRAGGQLSTLWLDKTAHQQIPAQSASQVITWIGDRLAGRPLVSSCGQALPVAPALPVQQ